MRNYQCLVNSVVKKLLLNNKYKNLYCQSFNDLKLTMDPSANNTSLGSAVNSDPIRTYANVLSKESRTGDISNNNPAELNISEHTILNGNQNSTVAVSESAVMDNVQNSENLDEISESDSFDDTENSQLTSELKTGTSTNCTGEESVREQASLSSNTKVDDDQIDVNECESSGGYSESGEESDLEDDDIELDNSYHNSIKWKFRPRNPVLSLPETVTVLETRFGSKVYIVGTAHFSLESQEDVAKTIRAVQPDIVMIELDKSRVNILSLDEKTILEESKNMNFQKIRLTIQQNGFLQGVLYLLLLSMSAHLTKQLGMAPGGEFRQAFAEAKRIPGCLVHLGDRPIHITLQRALATLSWWQKLRIAWYMLRAKGPISKEEVERCKQKDLLEEMLAEMTGEFPDLSRVFVKERDIYLTYSLQMSATNMPSPLYPEQEAPKYVVGVVGIGHVPGIKENWEKVSENDVAEILRIPKSSVSSKVIRSTVRLTILGIGMYGIYRIFPTSLIPKAIVNLPKGIMNLFSK